MIITIGEISDIFFYHIQNGFQQFDNWLKTPFDRTFFLHLWFLHSWTLTAADLWQWSDLWNLGDNIWWLFHSVHCHFIGNPCCLFLAFAIFKATIVDLSFLALHSMYLFSQSCITNSLHLVSSWFISNPSIPCFPKQQYGCQNL